SLSQPALKQAKGTPQPLSATRDRAVRTEGDLRRLLVPAPRGARDKSGGRGADAWMDAAEVASTYERPERAFSGLLEAGFRRAADVQWTEGALDVDIRLTQYRDLESTAAQEAATSQQNFVEQGFGEALPDYIPGSGLGAVYVGSRVDAESGRYEGEAVASRGDLVMDIWFSSDRPINKKRAVELARAQWGRM
ncbi:hypothetical protein G3I40_38935, partial [Streptomyces sp. SID14478]|uniref:hypothetical protein n=1 Tax=Streptomyces sp. SID14478 TaxID=2706073 RepID=UPI0013E00C07